MKRLKKFAEIQDLAEQNMPQNVLLQAIQTEGDGVGLESIAFRERLNDATKYIVEVWKLIGGKYVVFSGKYDGGWTIDDIEVHENSNSGDPNNDFFNDEMSALTYIQQNLMQNADSMDNVMAKNKNRLKRKLGYIN